MTRSSKGDGVYVTMLMSPYASMCSYCTTSIPAFCMEMEGRSSRGAFAGHHPAGLPSGNGV